jgi:predicted transcriptional regulator
MSVIFYPIKPKYAQKIISGEKRFEYRRVKPQRDVKHIVIYSSSPEKLILGLASVSEIITGTSTEVWDKTHKQGGISLPEYESYFHGANTACAIAIDIVYKLEVPFNPKLIFDNFTIPQSFKYLDTSSVDTIMEKGKGQQIVT